MNVLLSGGTGLIGRALCRALLARGDAVSVLSRRPERVAELCGAGDGGDGKEGALRAIQSPEELPADMRFDAVVNLAGAPIVGRRWSARRKRVLRESRVALTARLVRRMAAARVKPAVLLSGSAVGIYGDAGEVDEGDAPGDAGDFGVRLCAEWEREARAAEAAGVRVCLLRTGLVLSRDGGMLRQMLPAYRLGLGARIGDGLQWMSWVHIADQVGMMLKLLDDSALRGAFNLTAPGAVTNGEFNRRLATAVRRPAVLTVPALALKAALGESAGLLTGGQCVRPTRLLAAGYRFQYPELDSALREVLGG